MTLQEINGTAFAGYLRYIGRDAAAAHLTDCILTGSPDDNMAWDLMDAVPGEQYKVNVETVTSAVDALFNTQK